MFVFLLKVIGTIIRYSADFIENSGTKIYLNAEKTRKIFANACWVIFSVNGLNAQKKTTTRLQPKLSSEKTDKIWYHGT